MRIDIGLPAHRNWRPLRRAGNLGASPLAELPIAARVAVGKPRLQANANRASPACSQNSR
jgi:hypothetical protein